MNLRRGVCPECGFDWEGPPENLQLILESARDRFAATIANFNEDQLRTRPAAKVWSAMEYMAHTRDGVAWYTERIFRILNEDRPQLSGIDQEAETEGRNYHLESTQEVLSGLGAAASSLANLLRRLSSMDWSRPAIGSEGDHRDVLQLARRATHETEHHCWDAGRSLNGDASL